MPDVAYKAIAARREELAKQLDLLQDQLKPVTDDAQARQAEIDAVRDAIAELDDWLGQNPAVNVVKSSPVFKIAE